MAYITLPNSETSISIDDSEIYIFNTVTSIEANDPMTVDLIVSPQGTSDGLALKKNLTQSVVVTIIVRDVEQGVSERLDAAWEDEKRITMTIADLKTGKTISIQKAVLGANPSNVKIDENESIFDVTLMLKVAQRNINTTVKEL
jgi:hypothetical protein